MNIADPLRRQRDLRRIDGDTRRENVAGISTP
jgi:hypothetical protein